MISSLETDSDVFERAVQLSLCDSRHKKSILAEERRSRYAKFLTCNVKPNPRLITRDREPSRIAVKKLRSILHKSRNLRRSFRKYIFKNVPMSSRIHCLLNKCNFNHEEVKLYSKHYHKVRTKIRKPFDSSPRMKRRLWSIRRLRKKFKSRKRIANINYQPLLTNLLSDGRSLNVYKNLSHRINYCKFTLSRDIEKNPGPPTVIDSNKTICAPYSQGNIALFGLNAGRQCVAMSLCALIYKHRSSIISSEDLVKIMNLGNELYSVLSRFHNQDFLLLTELPNAVSVFETYYDIQYSPSYAGNIHDVSSNVDFMYCMPLGN